MPYSTHVPPMVFPDTSDGHADARMRDPHHEVPKRFCTEYREGDNRHSIGGRIKRVCANRSCMGDRHHNWCFRCPAGFPYLTGDESKALWGEEGDRPLPFIA